MPSLKDFMNEAEDMMRHEDDSEEESEEEESPPSTPSRPLAASTPLPKAAAKAARKESEISSIETSVENDVKAEFISPSHAENESQVRRRKTTQAKDHIIQ